MSVISIISQKGGVGKTTTAHNIAAALQASGDKVIILDADPQGSAFDCYVVGGYKLVHTQPSLRPLKDVERFKSDFKHIIIDSPSGTSQRTEDAIEAADVVLIPIPPSYVDVYAAPELIKLVNKIKSFRETLRSPLKVAFIMTQIIKIGAYNIKLAKEIKNKLTAYELPIFQHGTTLSLLYREALGRGESVLSQTTHLAAKEILLITEELRSYL